MNISSDAKSCSIVLYDIVPEKFYWPELDEYHTYGVRLTTSEHMDILHDVSVCKKTTEHIVKLLNHYQVRPIHLLDVVEDLLP